MMTSLFKALLIILIAQLVQYICADGNQRIVYVSELRNDNEDYIAHSGEDDHDSDHICCAYGNCSCSSLDHALANLASNVVINITTDVTLSSLIKVSDIDNVAIIGYNNPTVNCRVFGGINLSFCNNCIMQGISWDGCGTDNGGGLMLTNSFNITIDNCSFQHSKVQAVLLSKVSGDVNINHCNFVENYYTGHGAAIYYQASSHNQLPVFTISDCNFTYNYHNAKSLVYIVSEHNNIPVTFFQNNFCHNQGVSVYAVNQNILLNGKGFFQNNTAEIGAGMYISDYSTVIFGENSYVTFSENHCDGTGTVFLKNHSNVIFGENSRITFSGNKAIEGGAIYSQFYSNITFNSTCEVIFNHNSAKCGGAIWSSFNSYIVFEENSSPLFSNNTATDDGGAIYSRSYNYILFKGNSSPIFKNNIANHGGGAIYSLGYIYFEGNSSPIFSNNIADDNGGAISSSHSHILFEGNSSPLFSSNNAAQYGGAIDLGIQSTIFCKGNTSPTFSDNIAYYGGAISSLSAGNVSFEGFSAVAFRNNIAKYGGAIFVNDRCDIIFSDSSTVTFTNNNATLGATIYSENSTITTTRNPTVIINNLSPKWCNNTCVPYNGQGNTVVTIDSNGIVLCSDQKSFICLSKKCYCRRLEDLLDGLENNKLIKFSDDVTLSSIIKLESLNNITITGYNNNTVFCVNGGGLYLASCSNLIIEGIIWIGCGNYDKFNPVIDLGFSNLTIQNCIFQYSVYKAISFHGPGSNNNVTINNCNFMNNTYSYKEHGVAIHCLMGGNDYEVNIIINNCNFSYNHGDAASIIYFAIDNEFSVQHKIYLNTSNFYNNQGVPVYVEKSCTLHVNGEILFKNNVAKNGAGIYISDNSTVIFDESSNGKLINNSVEHNGAAIFLTRHSNIMFEQNFIGTFTENKATNGTVYSEVGSNVTFKGTHEVTFFRNLVTQYGAAIYSSDNSHVTFTGNSKVTFINNVVSSNDKNLQYYGGSIYSENNGHISFEGNSFTVFSNNTADYGAAIFSYSNSSINFKDCSQVIFRNNIAQYCGVLSSALFSSIIYKDYSKVSYDANKILCTSNSNSAAMCTFQRTDVIFSGHSLVTFTNNTAFGGGALVFSNSNVIIEEYSIVTFNNNIAQYSSGGAFTCYNNSNVTIKDNSNVTFNNNKASQSGGAIYSYNMCKITFKDNSTSTFVSNTARSNGGAILSSQPSEIIFQGNSIAKFDDNAANNGGALYFTTSTITIKESSMVSFHNNKAIRDGGAGYLNSLHCMFILEDNTKLIFDNNMAFSGGALCINMMAKFIVRGNSTTFFYNNLADVGGGAIKVLNDSRIKLQNHSIIKFTNNSAQYGGAIFLDTTAIMINNSDNKCIDFTNNIAKISGNSVYQDASEFCTGSCLSNRMGINHEFVDTPPNELKFNDPAICIDNGSTQQCNSYFIMNKMLGKSITMPACVLDYYNQSVDSLQFLVQSEANLNYIIHGPKQVVISCNDTFEKISIIGNQSISNSTNFSITITLNTALYSDWKKISVNLIIELSPCHPGFWQYPNSPGCECYMNASDIVFCFGSNSTIKRGYWFGNVTGKPTVAYCPINYCNFTCCETSNGYYHLSPVRDNQCRSHRNGTACGNCEEGYTLSFDSVECINVNECSTGKTILVFALILLYWIAIITSVFLMMHFKVGIGNLYAITYYYSVVDLMLNQNWYLSSALNTTINAMSSIAKIIPQFLGKLCFITNMSGIDQQFIHYIHPIAVSLFLVIITALAKRSRRLSNFISKGIIHVICYLLLLSYTSLATTSLLLMRPLIFHDVDKVYTYVSPDIEYFHGRHLAYAIVAVLFTIVIVIGLPLLLALEPFLNSKINFIKIKPLLDQFQSCYKDKYRCFAAYYMICRLVIIIIIIANSSNDFVFQYLLITACVIMALIHQLLKPYSNSLLNDFDGTILQLLVLISVLPLVEIFSKFDANLLVGITFILVILPLLIFITMWLMINKEKVKRLPEYCYTKCTLLHSKKYHDIPLNEPEDENEFVNVIDDSRRVNATICDV